MKATPPSAQQGDVGELDVAVEPDAPAGAASAATSGAGSRRGRSTRSRAAAAGVTARTRPSRAGRSRRPGCRRRHSRRPSAASAASAARGADTRAARVAPARAVAAAVRTVAPRDARAAARSVRIRSSASTGSRTVPWAGAPTPPSSVDEVAHQDRRPAVARPRRPRGTHRRADCLLAIHARLSTAVAASQRLADVVVAGRPDDPVVRGGARLRTNRSRPRSSGRNVGPGPAVGRERAFGRRRRARARPAGRRACARASRSRACGGGQHGAGTSWSPGGPSSRYSTNESGQLRVSTTTSGSIVEAFSSTWTSPAGM